MLLTLKYYIVINIITYFAYFLDKLASKKKNVKGSDRISEQTLLLLTIFGGAIGAHVSMNTFRHKTSKDKFVRIVNIFSILHFLVITYLIFSL